MSSEKNEMTSQAGVEGRGGDTSGVVIAAVGMAGYYPLLKPLTAITCLADSARNREMTDVQEIAFLGNPPRMAAASAPVMRQRSVMSHVDRCR